MPTNNFVKLSVGVGLLKYLKLAMMLYIRGVLVVMPSCGCMPAR